jgi:LytS/YehU family sensor histidine kinase
LQFAIVTPKDTGEIFLPSLSLQTLVENAVKHGIAKSVEGGRIEICIEQHAPQWYQLRVTNSGATFSSQANASGTGLMNTQERLHLLYGPRHQFNLGRDEAGQTCASFYFTGEKID